MCKYSRRDFLVHSTAASLLMLQTNRLTAADAPAAGKPIDMAIAKWKDAASAKATDERIATVAAKLANDAVEGLGGMKRFVKRGDVVWIKPNIGWDRKPEQAANTNPAVVAAIVKMCFDAGAKVVKIGDNTVNASARCYESSGISAAVKPLGAEVVYLDKSRFKEVDIKGERVKTMLLYPDIIDCDLVINVPVAKHHVLSNATIAMKNYMGVMDNRAPFHQDFATCLSDLTRFMKPQITVLDAVRVLTAHGPTGGKLEDVAVRGTVAAGVDIVAIDALGLELLGNPASATKKAVSILKFAQQAELGKMDYHLLSLKEISVA
jgi:uncharacterized protein (DUF362 family)